MGTHREILKRHRVPIALVAGNLAFASLFMTLALSAFHQPTPHDLKVGVVGAAPVTRTLQRKLDTAAPGVRAARISERDGGPRRDRRPAAGRRARHRATRSAAADRGRRRKRRRSRAHHRVHRGHGRGRAAARGGRRRPAGERGLAGTLVVLRDPVRAVPEPRHRRRGGPFVAAPAAGAARRGPGRLRDGDRTRRRGIADGVSGLGNYLPIAGIVALFSLAISLPTAALGEIKPPLVVLAVLVFLILGLPSAAVPAAWPRSVRACSGSSTPRCPSGWRRTRCGTPCTSGLTTRGVTCWCWPRGPSPGSRRSSSPRT